MPNLVFDPKFTNHWAGIGNDTRKILKAFDSIFSSQSDAFIYNLSALGGHSRKVRDFATSTLCKPITLKPKASDDLVFIPHISGAIPSRGAHAIWRIHDLFPLTNPEWFTGLGVRLFLKTFKNIDFENNFFLCNSQTTRSVLSQLTPVKEENMAVVLCEPSQDDLIKCGNCEGCEFKFSSVKYLLNVNTIEPRKNVSQLINIWRNIGIIHPQFNLLIVGQFGWKVSKFEMKNLMQNNFGIIHLKNVCDGSLNNLFEGASGYISASFSEGFNIPAEKARTYNLPLLLSDIPVHRELYESLGTYFFDFSSGKMLQHKIIEVFSGDRKGVAPIHERIGLEVALAQALKQWKFIR